MQQGKPSRIALVWHGDREARTTAAPEGHRFSRVAEALRAVGVEAELADFLYGPKTASGEDTYVLCEINVSAVSPFPDEALAPLARATKENWRLACNMDDGRNGEVRADRRGTAE